jgi:competence protein ComEC
MVFLPLGSLAAYPAAVAARYVISAARLLASVPFSSVYASHSPMLAWLLLVYAMFVALPLLKATARQYLYAVCAAAMALCAVLLISSRAAAADGTTVTVLDVGQGQCIAVESGGHAAVIDCGSSSGEDAGALARAYLEGRGITSIDLLILTHFHADHVNGVEYILSMIGVSALVIPDPEGSYYADDIIDLARKRGADIIYVTETLSAGLGGEELILYPPLGDDGENERCLAVLCLGDVSALITGDMPASLERRLLRFAYLPDIDLLVAGHHGSRFSTSEDLLAAVRPEIAAISVGRNSYGHPSDETLERLELYGVAIMRTDRIGNVVVGG